MDSGITRRICGISRVRSGRQLPAVNQEPRHSQGLWGLHSHLGPSGCAGHEKGTGYFFTRYRSAFQAQHAREKVACPPFRALGAHGLAPFLPFNIAISHIVHRTSVADRPVPTSGTRLDATPELGSHRGGAGLGYGTLFHGRLRPLLAETPDCKPSGARKVRPYEATGLA